MAAKTLTSAVDLFSKSYKVVRKNLNVYAILFSVSAAITVAQTIALLNKNEKFKWNWENSLSGSSSTPDTSALGLTIAVVALLVIVVGVLSMLTYIANLQAAQDKKFTLKELWAKFTANWLWLRLIGLQLLLVVMYVVGFLLLIVPGIILIWRLYFAIYILIDQNVAIDQAISKSWNMTKGYAWPVYSILLFGLLLSVTSIIPVVGPVVSFILVSAYTVAGAFRYFELKHAK